MIEVVSFDADGTLMDRRFMDSVWLERIPHLYAAKHRIPFERAKELVTQAYERVGDRKLEWYDLGYWLSKFELKVGQRELLEACERKVKPYPEVPWALNGLRREGFRLVVITNAPRELVNFQLEHAQIGGYFERVFSSFSDFKLVKKTKTLYRRVLRLLGVLPHQVAHVGDHLEFDFHVPRKLGMVAFYLDRSGKSEGEFVIRDLRELKNKLEALAVESLKPESKLISLRG